jgi:hypothetical protein
VKAVEPPPMHLSFSAMIDPQLAGNVNMAPPTPQFGIALGRRPAHSMALVAYLVPDVSVRAHIG